MQQQMTDQRPPEISSDPEGIPEKAKAGFSYREFGFIAAEQYFRSNQKWGYLFYDVRVLNDGLHIAGEIALEYHLDQYDMTAFLAGWRAYLKTIETPVVSGITYKR
jgi:hypothetical protein